MSKKPTDTFSRILAGKTRELSQTVEKISDTFSRILAGQKGNCRNFQIARATCKEVGGLPRIMGTPLATVRQLPVFSVTARVYLSKPKSDSVDSSCHFRPSPVAECDIYTSKKHSA